eukprot:6722118-Pyramimonas_sp.AAC.1
MRSATQGASGAIRMAAPPHFGTLSRVSWPQWLRLHAPAAFILAHPSHASWPHKGVPPPAPVAAFAWAHRAMFGTPLARFVAV